LSGLLWIFTLRLMIAPTTYTLLRTCKHAWYWFPNCCSSHKWEKRVGKARGE